MIFDVFLDTIMITSFVLVIMLIIEYINVQSHGSWLNKFENRRWAQYLIAGTLGIVPGCVGTFGVVSMYVHNMISFGALVTALLATFGDEAFVMFALMPLTTIKLTLIIFALGIVVGIVVDIFIKDVKLAPQLKSHFELHHSDAHGKILDFSIIKQNVVHLSFPRATLLGGLVLILLGIASGQFNESHGHGEVGIGWEQISFFVIMLIGLFIIIRVSDHFLEEHLWQHLIKKHFLKIFLWTFGALFFIEIFQSYLHLEGWIKSNQLIILLLALVIGIIPESGPHLIFVTLFMSGAIPFTTLLASSIVQDGHGALPLLAESKKSFFLAKGINILVGLLVGLIGLYLI
jgi:hypothetical protein